MGLVVEAEPALAVDCDHRGVCGFEGEFNASGAPVLEVGTRIVLSSAQPEEARRRRHIGPALHVAVTLEIRCEAHHAAQRAGAILVALAAQRLGEVRVRVKGDDRISCKGLF